MKKLIVVSKTHLDLGFTDYAENIRRKYINEFFPNAEEIAEKLNIGNEKNFVWTTGSWIIREALNDKDENRRAKLIKALKCGNIAPHAMPFTTHSELLDEDTFNYGLSIVDEIDKITGRKTVAAKMTDVPGHTIGIVPLLASHGIKLLHIGVNGASALPEVPPCFLWKCGESEIVVIYSGDYGGEFKCDFVDDILYFDHSVDNRGTKDTSVIIEKLDKLKAMYPGYTVAAGRMDDYAEIIWNAREKLPVITSEIGDSWIHGSAADPYKSAAVREMIRSKNNWLRSGTLTRGSEEYNALCEGILCLCEHTCGMDVKRYFADYENYLRPDFERARKADSVKLRHPLRDFPQNFLTILNRKKKEYQPGSYSVIEKSWAEQREYINTALRRLSKEHCEELSRALKMLMPESTPQLNGEELIAGKEYSYLDKKIAINQYGAVEFYSENGAEILRSNQSTAVCYHSYGQKDYDFWLSHYTRNYKETSSWCVGDFARPLLKYCDKKYKQGDFLYKLAGGAVSGGKILAQLKCDDYCHTSLGAPADIYILYSLSEEGLTIELTWIDKPANRLTESLAFNLTPLFDEGSLRYNKLAAAVNPYSIVRSGNRKLSAVESVDFSAGGCPYRIENLHSPLAALGKVDILHFDNEFNSASKDGLSFVLHDNVWGTNFPLWYEGNAYFKYIVKNL